LRSLADRSSNGTISIRSESPLGDVRDLAEWATACRFDLPDLDVRRPTLEDVYLALTAHGKES
jgi:ABC-2 type transport system ATP-binding protein